MPQSVIVLGYISAMAPPGHLCNLVDAGKSLMNMLKAHTEVYHALKALPGGELSQIGLVHLHITYVLRHRQHVPGSLLGAPAHCQPQVQRKGPALLAARVSWGLLICIGHEMHRNV